MSTTETKATSSTGTDRTVIGVRLETRPLDVAARARSRERSTTNSRIKTVTSCRIESAAAPGRSSSFVVSR